MSDIYDKVRIVYGKLPDEEYPVAICAADEVTLEWTTHEDWDKWVHGQAQHRLGSEWQSYSFIEVLVTIPQSEVQALFAAQEITAAKVEAAPHE